MKLIWIMIAMFFAGCKNRNAPGASYGILKDTLESCYGSECSVQYDTIVEYKLFRYKDGWISLMYPSNDIKIAGEVFSIEKDFLPFYKAHTVYETFLLGTERGYRITAGARTYLIMYGSIQGATGISSNYKLVLVIRTDKGNMEKFAGVFYKFSIDDIVGAKSTDKIFISAKNRDGGPTELIEVGKTAK